MKAIWTHTFLLTQGDSSATVYIHTGNRDDMPSGTWGLWKSDNPSFDFRDTSDHNQWLWFPFGGILRASNDIGLYDTGGPGHTTDFQDKSSWAFTLYDLPKVTTIHRPASGDGEMHFAHSHALRPGAFTWEYQALHRVEGWGNGA